MTNLTVIILTGNEELHIGRCLERLRDLNPRPPDSSDLHGKMNMVSTMTQRLDLKNYKNRHSTKSKVARMVWNVVWLFLFRPTPRGNLFRPWRILLLKLFGGDVKWSSNVLPSCRIWQPWKLKMGAYACLGADVDCYAVAPIVLGDNAVVSQGVKLCTASHDIASPIMELTYTPIVIEANAWVAAWSIVLPGVTVGEGAVVGAGAVVTKDVAPWTVVGGNPAKVIGKRELK